jgi:predicted nuclease of predicted toxin-antitoxin system
MKIKLDENLPATLAAVLAAAGHDVDTVPQEGLEGQSDPEVWRQAQRTGRFFVTQDLDFSDIRRFKPGTHARVLLVRLAKPGRLALTRCVQRAFSFGAPETWAECFVVVTESKIRVRHPSEQG